MTVLVPNDLHGALAALGDHPEAQILAGGTDFMVEVNAGHRRPTSILALRRVSDLRRYSEQAGSLVLGAGLTYTDLQTPAIADRFPALAAAARTVGSPQIRNAGTLGGNVATASPAGDTLPVLAALDAEIELAAVDGSTRRLGWREFFTGVKRTARRPDELITGVRLPISDARQDYLKVGTRNAMVISVAGLSLVVDLGTRSVRCGLGSVAPVPVRADEAERFLTAQIDWDEVRLPVPSAAATFASLVAAAARPIDDHRSTALYRTHAVEVMARRAVGRLLP